MVTQISGPMPAAGAQASAVQQWQSQRQSFKSVLAALKAGDADGAQKAFANIAGTNGPAQAGGALQKLGNAVQSGALAPPAASAQQQPLFSKPGHTTPVKPPTTEAEAAVQATASLLSPAAQGLLDLIG